MTLTADNRRLEGKNNQGQAVSGYRMNENNIKVYKQAIKMRKNVDKVMNQVGDFLKKGKKN